MAAVFLVIVLVIVFGGMESYGWTNRGDDPFVEAARFNQGLLAGRGQLTLLFTVVENCRSVLVPAVVKRAARIGGVDLPPIDIEQLLVRDFLGIKSDLYGLYVLGPTRGNLFVARIYLFAPCIARYCRDDALDFVKGAFDAPKTPAGKGSFGVGLRRTFAGY